MYVKFMTESGRSLLDRVFLYHAALSPVVLYYVAQSGHLSSTTLLAKEASDFTSIGGKAGWLAGWLAV